MKSVIVGRLAAILLLTGSLAALAQSSYPQQAAQAPNADVEGSGPIPQPPQPPRPPRQPLIAKLRHLLYVALPGSLERPFDPQGGGIVVLNADQNYAFVKRIHVWDYAASLGPEPIGGVAANPATNMMYVAAAGRLGAIDLATDKLVWSTTLGGHCCERPSVTADGKTIVVGSEYQDYWLKVDARTGKLEAIIHTPGTNGAHNMNLSPDGKLAFLSAIGPQLSIADVATAKVIRTITFPDNIRVQVLNKDASKIYVNQDNFLGYMIADTHTGKILKSVEVNSVNWRAAWNKSPRVRPPHGCPSHGIALTQDGKEVWLADGIFNKIHVFSNTDNPKEIATIDTPDGVYWLTPSVDGKLFYASSGDVIDVATHKVIGTQKDEYGDVMGSEKELELAFSGGHLQRASNQFGNEFGDFQNAEKIGVGLHMPVIPGFASAIATPTGSDPNDGLVIADAQAAR